MDEKRTAKKDAEIRKKQVGQQFQEYDQTGTKVNFHYKDTIFRMLFKEKENLLDLYNAVSGKDYTDPAQLEIVTLENAIYMGIKNDLAFLIDFDLYLFEHQSTVNKNMPLRFLAYVTAEYDRLTAKYNLYRGRPVQIPAPHFIVFYNGVEPCDEREELRLSDMYQTKEEEQELELRVQVLNINAGFNEDLKTQCRILGEYMQYVEKVRDYVKEMPIDKAVDKAVDECIGQDILKDFLLKNKAEVKHMSIFEYDEEATRRGIREYAHEQGRIEGREEGELVGKRKSVLYLLEESGSVPGELRKRIMEETSEEILRNWLKLASRAESIDEFTKEML